MNKNLQFSLFLFSYPHLRVDMKNNPGTTKVFTIFTNIQQQIIVFLPLLKTVHVLLPSYCFMFTLKNSLLEMQKRKRIPSFPQDGKVTR